MRSWCFGAAAALLGALLWTLMVYNSGRQFGILAWVLGAGVGIAVAISNRDNKAEDDAFTASLLAFLSLVLAKVLILTVALPAMLARDIEGNPHMLVVAMLLDDAPDTPEASPKLLKWLSGETPGALAGDTLQELQTLRRHAHAQLRELSEPDKQARLRAYADNMLANIPTGERIGMAFQGYDLLWFALAVITAHRIAGQTMWR